MSSIKNKISFLVSLLIFLLLIVSSVYIYLEIKDQYINNEKDLAKLMSKNLSSRLSHYIINRDENAIKKEVIDFITTSNLVYVIVEDKSSIIYEYNLDKANGLNYRTGSAIILSQDKSAIKVQVNIMSSNNRIGNLFLGFSLQNVYNYLNVIVKQIIIISLIVITLGGLFGYFIGSFTLRPINSIMKAAQSIREGNLNTQIIITTKDELGILSDVFNKMIDKINEFYSNLNKMVHDRTEQLNKLNIRLSKEIDEKIQNEMLIKSSLKEKEILLKEIHHRVKNNLQIISSLLSLQSKKLNNKMAETALLDSQMRVRSMALVHEKLYNSNNLSSIDFPDYIKELVKDNYESYHYYLQDLKIEYDLQKIYLPIDIAISLGLIVNELVTNIFKYAFPLSDSSILKNIWITLKETGNKSYLLSVADNGIGFEEDFKIERTNSLGLKLVSNLVKQINANLTIIPRHNTEFRIQFSI